MSTSPESGYWLRFGNRVLFVGHHRTDDTRRASGTFIFCGPFAEEKNKSQRLLVDTARAFSATGFNVLRLDYAGTGDSPGDFVDATMETRLQDVLDAIVYCRNVLGESNVGLLGLRLGGALAALAAEKADVRWLVLLSPVADVRKHFSLALRGKRIKEMLTAGTGAAALGKESCRAEPGIFDLDGFPITPHLHAEMQRFDVIGRILHYRGPLAVIHASLNPRVPKDVQALRDRYSAIGASVSFATVYAEPFWNMHSVPPFERIIDTVTAWLRANSRAGVGAREERAKAASEPSIGEAFRVETPRGYEEAGYIPVPDGFLSCIWHIPLHWKERADTAVLLVHGRAGCRIGPHRMLVTAARKLCGEGYLCLRVDVRGRGASSGPSHMTDLETILADAECAASELRQRFQPGRLVVLGQCWGGSATFPMPEADGTVMWSAPPIDVTTGAKLRKSLSVLRQYSEKLMQRSSWHKLFTGRLNRRLIVDALCGHFRGGSPADGSSTDIAAFVRRRSLHAPGRPCLFIYGDKDPDTQSARHKYALLCRDAGMIPDFHIVSGANHAFYSIGWEEEVLRVTSRWLHEHFRNDTAFAHSPPFLGPGESQDARRTAVRRDPARS